MDEHVVVDGGDTVEFHHPFADVNEHDLGFFTAKHNAYAIREAIEVLNQRYSLLPQDHGVAGRQGQASWKRLLKERVYNRIPFYVSAPSYFLYRYVLQLGVLDGVEGLIYHGLQGGWYRFLVGARVVEFDRVLKPLASAAARRDALEQLTGYKFHSQAAAVALRDPERV